MEMVLMAILRHFQRLRHLYLSLEYSIPSCEYITRRQFPPPPPITFLSENFTIGSTL